MKSSLLRLLAIVLLNPLASPLTRLAAAAEKAAPSSAPAKFTLKWTRGSLPDLQFAQERLAAAEKRVKLGTVPEDVVSGLRHQVWEMERRAPYLLNLKSTGGPLSALVTAASSSGDMSFMVINAGEPADLETQLPAFELRNANWGTLMSVLENILLAQGLQLTLAGSDTPNPAESKSVVCVLRRIKSAPDEKRIYPSDFVSFQLAEHIFEGQSAEVIVDAIRSAWELEPNHDPNALRVKYHPATKILLVAGPGPATNIARQVVSGLRKNSVQR